MRGRFISLEGQDGSGKSSQLLLIKQLIESLHGVEVVVTREPGGTPLGEELRRLALHSDMNRATEALLMAAARCEHLDKVIHPALEAGKWVLTDRYVDSSYAYQCGGRGIRFDHMNTLVEWSTNNFLPDLTFLFDVDPEKARSRIGTRDLDKFEQEDLTFAENVAKFYLQRVGHHSQRFLVIDASQSAVDVARQVISTFSKWNPSSSIRPPDGIVPQHIYRSDRIDALKAVIDRYELVGFEVPKEWIAELNQLTLNPTQVFGGVTHSAGGDSYSSEGGGGTSSFGGSGATPQGNQGGSGSNGK